MDEIEQRVVRAAYEECPARNLRAGGAVLPWDGIAPELRGVYARAAIDAYKAALADAGMVIVPREPTPEMVRAAIPVDGSGFTAIWRAMIDAAEIPF